jgi:hypothetical protein
VTVAVAKGDVLVADAANPGQLTTTATAGATTVIGVAAAAGAAGATIDVALPGSVIQVNGATGVTTVGQMLTTSTTAGKAIGAAAAQGACIGKCLEAKANAAGPVWAVLGWA